ncbi:hypothetical protein ABVT39_018608 [Epinephelus coioides]
MNEKASHTAAGKLGSMMPVCRESTLLQQCALCISFIRLCSRRQNRFKAVLAGPAAA